ncbi:cytochrome P450 [Frankia sp. CNm7]|uniref:Cytochrome P450 n=1 Tax=Frankia nepalensis TaxID=1836974 RepID=A0A937RHU1_9ACTN|nr:cytochrome P450 [Frankia nepalensis]MBL7501706.1 cytochrome P450 [Frankia nepalensis]MBL7513465.1 cytochrome P450 [Frankia nepalensis]MBL7521101.1 cytochrome P450 [Frankia nepalensis]MBL7632508.1 cytochrome P450 [Frankia nepalensis]
MTMPATAGESSLLDLRSFNPFGPHVARAYEFFAQARAHEPVFFSDSLNAWCLTRYEDVRRVAADATRFSSREAFPRPVGLPSAAQRVMDFLYDNPTLLLTDPPGHGPVRRIVHEGFSPRAVAGYEPHLREIIEGLADQLVGRERFDLVRDFATTFPLLGAMRVLGFAPEHADDLGRWVNDLLTLLASWPFLDPDGLRAHGESFAGAFDYLNQVIEQRRRHPADDLISFMVHNEVQGRRLADVEIADVAVGVLAAGWETTGNALVSLISALLAEPERWRTLVAGRIAVDAAIAEGLRYDMPILGTFRRATEDVEIGGKTVRAGDAVVLLFAAANHDPAQFAQPSEFRLDRPRRPDMAFGHGVHNCVGAPLAKLELSIALEALVARFPDLKLDDPDAPVTYKPMGQFKERTELWLRP